MFFFKQPDRDTIQRVLETQRSAPFSYAEVGATAGLLPPGYNVDHNRVRLGLGGNTYAKAVAALQRWAMFELGWAQICWPHTSIEVGNVVGVLAHHLGFWSLNICRIVYRIDEHEPTWRYGFAYGTLGEHAERGEERFSVEWRADDSVWYDVLAFSRPQQPLAIVGYPITRLLQRRFGRATKKAMLSAVEAR